MFRRTFDCYECLITTIVCVCCRAMIRDELSKNPAENFAIVNIPMNLTAIPYHKRRHPPWTLI